ncbi:MAG: dockerin type I domain-containing protein [Planctomycetota bacterium]|nr:dockerin type I domain-containing protein [Planctomycetota bacterium]
MNTNIRLVIETLEARNLLTADMVAFQNPLLYQDVNFDQFVSQIDALQVINHVNGVTESEPAEIQSFLDVDGDDAVSGIDALRIINNLNGVEVTHQSIFEQMDDFVDEIETMDDLIPAELVQISQDVVAEMQSQSARLTAMRTDLEEFLRTPRHDRTRIADRLANIRVTASELSEDILSDLNGVNGDAVDQHIEHHDLHKLGIHQRLHDKFTEIRELKRHDHKWEDYLPHGEVTQQQVDHHAARLEKAFGQGILPDHIDAGQVNQAIRSLRENNIFDFRYGDGQHDFANAPVVTPVDVTQQWTGYIVETDFSDIDSRHDFIVDSDAFAELWNDWNAEQVLPVIDFAQEMVVVAVVPGPNQIMMQPALDTHGNLMLKAASTRMGGPGFSYAIQVVSRTGVDSVNHVDLNRPGGLPTTEEIAQERIGRLRGWVADGNLPDFIAPDQAERILTHLEDGGTPLGRFFRRLGS